jgi:glutathione S-transferase
MLRQSLPILEYLEEAYPDTPKLLPPDDTIQRARIREVAEIVNSLIQPMQKKRTVERVAELNEEFAAWLQKATKAHGLRAKTLMTAMTSPGGHNGGFIVAFRPLKV